MADINLPGMGPTPARTVYAGGIVVAGAVVAWTVYRRHQASAAAAIPAASSTATDPNAIDPATGMTYAAEQSAYGAGVGPGGYASPLGPFGGGGYVSPTGFTNPVTGFQAPISNAQWTQQAAASLGNIGFDPIMVTTVLGKFLAGTCLTAAEADAVNTAIGYLGPPPVGTHQVTVCAPTTAAPGPANPVLTHRGGGWGPGFGRPYSLAGKTYFEVPGDALGGMYAANRQLFMMPNPDQLVPIPKGTYPWQSGAGNPLGIPVNTPFLVEG